MADRTGIAWTNATWNPVRGCERVSEGCRNCYAEVLAARHSYEGGWGEGLAKWVERPGGIKEARWTGVLRTVEELLDAPLRWRRPRRVFVNSMSDLFHEDVPDEFIDQVFAVMALATQHTFQILTKRPERMAGYVNELYAGRMYDVAAALRGPALDFERAMLGFASQLPNVWLGVSVEDQARADERIPLLLHTPAAVRWISAEPLLGPVDLTGGPDPCRTWLRSGLMAVRGLTTDKWLPPIDWVVVGGESGPGARPMHPDWARSLRDQCAAAGVPFFFKQWGAWSPQWAWRRAVNVDPSTANARNPNEHMGPRGLAVQGPDTLFLVSKKTAGRRLDGRTHDEYPA